MASWQTEPRLLFTFVNGIKLPVNSKTAHPPRAIPGHLTRVKLRTVGNLTQNEARPVKTSVSGRKQKDFAIL